MFGGHNQTHITTSVWRTYSNAYNYTFWRTYSNAYNYKCLADPLSSTFQLWLGLTFSQYRQHYVHVHTLFTIVKQISVAYFHLYTTCNSSLLCVQLLRDLLFLLPVNLKRNKQKRKEAIKTNKRQNNWC